MSKFDLIGGIILIIASFIGLKLFNHIGVFILNLSYGIVHISIYLIEYFKEKARLNNDRKRSNTNI